MKIDTSKLPPEGIRLRSSEPPEIIDIESGGVIFNEPIEVDVFAQLVGDALIVKGTLNACPLLQCSRCLEYYPHPLDRPSYMFSTTVRKGEIIDLTESIREDIIIDLPIKPLCAEGCRGICPRCGKNINEGECGCAE